MLGTLQATLSSFRVQKRCLNVIRALVTPDPAVVWDQYSVVKILTAYETRNGQPRRIFAHVN